MKTNKLMITGALILLIIIPIAFAQIALPPIFGTIFGNTWVILFINSFIIWFILFTIQAFAIGPKEGKEKAAVWAITLILAPVIAISFGGGGDGYIWQVGALSNIFKIKVLVNGALISVFAWFVLGLLDIKTQQPQGRIGLIILAIIISFSIAIKIGPDTWIWSTNNFEAAWDYLFGPEKNDTFRGTPIKAGGILRPENYRLYIFLGSALLWSWFLSSFLNLGNNRLSYAIAILIAAIQARTGTPVGAVLALAEAFFLLLVGRQMGSGGGWSGLFGVGISILLVEFVFCSVFGASALFQFLGQTIGGIYIGTPGGWIDFGTPFDFLCRNNPCTIVASITGVPVAAAGGVTGPCGGGGGGGPRCGDGNCDPGEATSCPRDCGGSRGRPTPPTNISFGKWLLGVLGVIAPLVGWWILRRRGVP
ncbi:hypothetical protein HY637_04135 [Candidatus Woesearchaeota archaeon]|nr:hypothetical protein [Candidatus Pacearchaeota archaeon]MBI4452594.1 hypothetical protein [Candidatus Woesearchaeota archaeon]